VIQPVVIARTAQQVDRSVENVRQVITLCQSSTIINNNLLLVNNCLLNQIRCKHRDLRKNYTYLRDPPLGPNKARPPNEVGGKNSLDYRRIIHYPEDGKYTIKKLDITKLGGRHPVTGRKVIAGVGGGRKQKYRWIDWHRLPKNWPKDGTVLEERVVNICYDPIRKAKICLTGYDEFMRWQIATSTLKPGDIIRTYTDIPVIPIRPNQGDAHPLGALPIGTNVCLIEAWPGEGAFYMCKAEDSAKIIRRVGERVVIKCFEGVRKCPLEFAVPKEAMCVVGEVSIHPLKAMDIGSPNRMRWLGIKQRSGLWQRKDGTRGRKIKKPPPTIDSVPYAELTKDAGTPSSPPLTGRRLLMHCDTEGVKGRLRRVKFDLEKGDWPDTSRVNLSKW